MDIEKAREEKRAVCRHKLFLEYNKFKYNNAIMAGDQAMVSNDIEARYLRIRFATQRFMGETG